MASLGEWWYRQDAPRSIVCSRCGAHGFAPADYSGAAFTTDARRGDGTNRRASPTHGPDSMDNGIRNSPDQPRSKSAAVPLRPVREQCRRAVPRNQAARQQPALAGR